MANLLTAIFIPVSIIIIAVEIVLLFVLAAWHYHIRKQIGVLQLTRTTAYRR